MLSKEERKARNASFWDTFKKEMRSTKSSSGRAMSWVSYPSDVKDIYIRLETDQHGARLCFDIQAKDDGIRSILWEQMTELKKVLENEMTWETIWIEAYTTKEGKSISRIEWRNDELNFYKDEDWPLIRAFFAQRLVEFDRFYQEFKDILIALAD
jgi:hypothetical protein